LKKPSISFFINSHKIEAGLHDVDRFKNRVFDTILRRNLPIYGTFC